MSQGPFKLPTDSDRRTLLLSFLEQAHHVALLHHAE